MSTYSKDKPMYRLMPAAFLWHNDSDINNGEIKSNHTLNYISIYAWHPAFDGVFSGRPKHCSRLYKYRHFKQSICVEPLPSPVWRNGELSSRTNMAVNGCIVAIRELPHSQNGTVCKKKAKKVN